MKLLAIFIFLFGVTSSARPTFGKHGLVVSASQAASDAGIAIMKQGGNAVDGAVATALALSVTRPYYAAFGGGGFMVIRMGGKIMALDHRERAPQKSTPDMFTKSKDKDASEIGGLAVGTPGNVMGLFEAHKKFGKLPWSKLFPPAIELAQNGFMI